MKIISYNINGVRAAIKKGLIEWIKNINPDVICLQEIKAFKDQFDEKLFLDLGFHCFWHSAKKKGYSGVAILCKKKPNKVIYGMGEDKIDSEGRVLKIEYDTLSIYSVYFPSGSSGEIRQNYKMWFLGKFLKFWLKKLNKFHQQTQYSNFTKAYMKWCRNDGSIRLNYRYYVYSTC